MTSPATKPIHLGPVQQWQTKNQQIIFDCANQAQLIITILTPKLIRITATPNGHLAPTRSWSPALPDSEFPPAPFQTEEQHQTCLITTAELTLKINLPTSHLTILNQAGHIISDDATRASWLEATTERPAKIEWSKRIPGNEHYYGFGERTGLLDKLGRTYTNWSVDKIGHGPATNTMYQAIPFFMAHRPGESVGYGLYFNNSYKTHFDMGHARPGSYSFSAEGGALDYYFIFGPNPAQILENYTMLTGRMSLPPLWSLGYHQSRYSYYPEAQVREIARQFRDSDIPCDCLVLDIHYMDGYRVFTWDAEQFSDPAALTADLAKDGFKLVTIIDPGVKYDPDGHYQVYQSGLDQKVYLRKPADQSDSADPYLHGHVWPGDCLFPDFTLEKTRQWWAEQHQTHLGYGVAGIWNDMNEPAVFALPPQTGTIDFPLDAPVGEGETDATVWAEVHNLYALLENMATHQGLLMARPNSRPFILTRSGFAGIQKYAAVWTGDNHSYWEHLEMALPMLVNLGLSGVAFCGTDIGGFIGNASGELFARWMQFGVLSPFMRGHSAYGSEMHEPWVFGKHIEEICRRYLKLRYRLLPYLYTQFEQASRNGSPVLRPLFYEFPDDPLLAQLDDEVMLGPVLLAAPVLRPGKEYRYVYLPAGNWYDFWTNQPVQSGPTHFLENAPLEKMPLYVRGGSFLPLETADYQHTGQRDAAAPLALRLYPDANRQAYGTLYEDAGETFAYQHNQFRRTAFTCRPTASGSLLITASSEGAYQTGRTEIHLQFPVSLSIQTATLNNGPALPLAPADQPGLLTIIIPINDHQTEWSIELK